VEDDTFVNSNHENKNNKDLDEKLIKMAFQDELTKLPNHFLFKDRLDVAIDNSKRSEGYIAVCYLNIIRYKEINTRFGRNIGDKLLCQIANRLSSKIRIGDTLCRYEGDKFFILLMSVTPTSLKKILGRIKAVFDEPYLLEPYVINVKGRFGISIGNSKDLSGEPMIERAKYAEQYGKLMGYDEHIIELPGLPNFVSSDHDIFSPDTLRQAIEKNEFVIHFQPQVHLGQNKVVGFEALIRWNNPHYGLISPSAFIEVAEKSGIIAPLGLWVIEKVFSDLSFLKKKGYSNLKMAINLSPLQLHQKSFIKELKSLVKTYSIDTQMVEFELTENIILENTNDVKSKLKELYSMGFQLAIDDFGTGYSSLGYLFSLENIKLIKIDKSFVKNIESNKRKRLVLENIINMINDLQQCCLIEGVETEEQLQVVQSLGIQLVQGNYFSKPLTLNEVLESKFLPNL
jgi:diguanylate cyclase (GGDEF)-like protein